MTTNKNINDIGVIGQGFVGSTIKEVFSKHYKIHTFDLIKEKSSCDSLEDLVVASDIVFLCLPTPMKSSGECDISLVEDCLLKINDLAQKHNKEEFCVLIKSTVPPGTVSGFCVKFPLLNIIFNPEFLTEANAVEDYLNQNRIILGVTEKNTSNVVTIFNKALPKATVIKTKIKVAEMIKYVTNCFLSVKVSFANEIHQICEKMDIDYDKVIEYSKYDNRLGYSHWNVPGPDGDFGYGGHCFPKDISALKYLANSLDIKTFVLDGAIEKNNEVRQERDWEAQVGRAVSQDFFDKD